MEFVISHLVKSYGSKKVLKDVDFVFDEGKIYGLLGRNGSGKTTFFNCINSDIDIDSGSFYLREGSDSTEKIVSILLLNFISFFFDDASTILSFPSSDKAYHAVIILIGEKFP